MWSYLLWPILIVNNLDQQFHIIAGEAIKVSRLHRKPSCCFKQPFKVSNSN